MSSTRTASGSTSAANPTVLAVIRARTLTLHAQLESRFDLQHSLSSPANYRTLLQSYLQIYLPLERRIAAEASPDLLPWSQHGKVENLRGDLRVLGITQIELDHVADCPLLPDLHSLDSLLGALYVVEGSSLGGQYIYRQIQQSLALDEHSGAAFFHGDGERTGSIWKSFTTLLQSHVRVPEVAADTACEMFSLFESWLTKPH